MVIFSAIRFLQLQVISLLSLWAAQQTAPQPKLPEPVKQIALMALLGIALLGMLLIVATLLGGHWVRRWGDSLRRPAVPPDVILSRPQPPESPQSVPSNLNTGDTIATDETMSLDD